MYDFIVIMLLLFLVATAMYAVLAREIIDSIIALSIFSINLTLVFVVLQAPDVAMTEAVIGVGLLTALFVVAVNKTEEI